MEPDRQQPGETTDDYRARLTTLYTAKTNNVLKAIIQSLNIDQKLTNVRKRDLVELIVKTRVSTPRLKLVARPSAGASC